MRKGNWSLTRCSRVCREVFQDCGNRTLKFPRSLLKRKKDLRHSRRENGLQFPLHPQQVVGWLALVGISAGTFTVILPLLVENIKRILSSILGVTLSIHIISHSIALLLDPGEKEIRINNSLKILPEFDRDKHNHVIENGRCHLCNIDATSSRTKHCSICNKCIENFDHHCKWLNNCIGGRNYKAFIISVITAVLFVIIVTFITIIEITLINKNIDGYLFDLNNNNNNNNVEEKEEKKLLQFVKNMDNGTGGIPSLIITQSSSSIVPGTGSIIIIYLVGILSAIAAALLIHLCFFHGYIACLGITTYEYVKRKRDKKMAKNRDNINDGNNRNDNKRFDNNNSNFNFCTKYFNRNNFYDDDVDDDVDVGRKLKYQFRKSVYSTSSSTATAKVNSEYSLNDESDEKNVRISSKEIKESSSSTSSSSSSSSSSGIKGSKNDNRRNFHLYFSYETRDSETSIEVSSLSSSSNERILNNKIGIIKNNDDDNNENSIEKYRFKPSTPSPVSCCFSITNNNANNKSNVININKNINDINKSSSSSSSSSSTSTSTSTTNDGSKRCNRSCMTMRRIQSFLRTRLRRGSYNNRKKRIISNGDELTMAVNRPTTKRNKVNPTFTEDSDANDNGDSHINSTSLQSATPTITPTPPLPPPPHPLKLPPLIIPSRDNKMKQTTMIEAIVNSKNQSAATIAINQSKRSIQQQQQQQQQPLRIRRTSFYKRPRFKMGSHVTETAQLSPIPESEFSKPASPRTPPQINHFPFPSSTSSFPYSTTTLPPDSSIENSF